MRLKMKKMLCVAAATLALCVAPASYAASGSHGASGIGGFVADLFGGESSPIAGFAGIYAAPNEAVDSVVDGAARAVSDRVEARLNVPTSILPGCETTGSGIMSSLAKAAVVAGGVGTGIATSGAAIPFIVSLGIDYLGCAFLSAPENQAVSKMEALSPFESGKMEPGGAVSQSPAGVSSVVFVSPHPSHPPHLSRAHQTARKPAPTDS